MAHPAGGAHGGNREQDTGRPGDLLTGRPTVQSVRALPDHVDENRRDWDAMADEWVEGGEITWAGEPARGNWQLPEAEVVMLPDDMTGLRAIELGCGTGYVSAWMARRGVTVAGSHFVPEDSPHEIGRAIADWLSIR